MRSFIFLLCLTLTVHGNPATGEITRHLWTGTSGGAISDLTGLLTYPASPNSISTLTSFQAPTNTADNYGQRVFGWVHAPVTGNYIFNIAADDNAELWLSTSVSPEDRVRIANVPVWTNPVEWTKFTEQTSSAIPLVARQYYFIEVIHKEGSGGDNLAVAWSYPGQSRIVIPGSALSPWQNLAPELVNDAATLNVGGRVGIAVLSNDKEPNGTQDFNLAELQVITQPVNGTVVTDVVNGILRYTHQSTGTGSDSLVYQIRDQAGLTATAQVNFTIVDQARLPLVTSKMPAQPPLQTLSVVDAYPGLTFNQPLAIVSPPGDTQRVFIVEKDGVIRVIPNITSPQAQTFLELKNVVNSRAGESFQSGGEQGLLGLAFHPQYASNGRFFVVYSVNAAGNNRQRLAEFSVSNSNPNLANSTSEKVIIQQIDDASNHNGGDIHFGADGYLYMSWGDEGNSDDSLNNSQTITKDFWSSITRIDVDLEPMDYTANDGSAGDDLNIRPNAHPAIVLNVSGNPFYEIPADNPWVGATQFLGSNIVANKVRSEFWAVGVRNPWRMSFDPVTGILWCGDVGQGAREEVNKFVKGGNYEWAFREGFIEGAKWGSRPSGWTGSHPPIWDYAHGSGTFQGDSITGGVVYRGSNIASLTGKYIFSDYASGNIWALDDTTATPVVQRIAGEGSIAGFGRDPANGDVLMANLSTGKIRRLISTSVTQNFPATLEATGLFADTVTLDPNPGLVAYDVNLPFWSDHAIKRRWFGIPDTTSKIGFNREGSWNTPAGMVWVKHFDLELERGNAATKKRLETRVYVRNTTGAYGVSYRWNEAGTAATLADSAGEEFDLTVQENGANITQRWRIPSQAECMICHSPQAGHSLSFRTRQLNRDGRIAGELGNFIQLLANANYLENLTTSPAQLPRHVAPLETDYALGERARSYLEVNCSYCHSDTGTVPAQWDARSQITLAETGMVNGVAVGGIFHPQDRLLVPGLEQRSIILNRTAARNGYSRMPPLGTKVVDTVGVNLLKQWIEQELPLHLSYAAWRESFFGPAPSTGGEMTTDFDEDGRTNHQEFLMRTHPRVVDTPAAAELQMVGNQVKVTLPELTGRSVTLESSADLELWRTWQGPGNQGLPRATGLPAEFLVPKSPTSGFFRMKVQER